ncbi:GNAT family N-acetyltransferase [Burkholderiaceae bacterium DAT-1]|nr:GNAT family N-acetyltransferase [Burkholderiaceae bacterium DAT-1]
MSAIPSASLMARPASAIDSEDIWRWRNDPDTRAMSVTTEMVPWERHQHWFADSLSRNDRFMFVVELADGQKVGMCRFDLSPDQLSAEVSININPACRGQGFAIPLLAECIRQFSLLRPSRLTAIIKQSNPASERCFVANGFKLLRVSGEFGFYERTRIEC